MSSEDVRYSGLKKYLEDKYCPNCKDKDINFTKGEGIICERCDKTHTLDFFDDCHKKN